MFGMQKIIPLLGLCFVMMHSSCKKDPVNQIIIEESQVAGLVAGTIARDAKGLFSELDVAAYWTQRGLAAVNMCEYVRDSTFSTTNPSGSLLTYSFAQTLHTDVQCTNNLSPNLVHFNLTHNGLWETAKTKANGNGNGAWNITGVAPTTDDYTFNGDYSRNGTTVAKGSTAVTFSSDLRMQLKNILITKANRSLKSGEITFTVTGASSSGDEYSMTGTITILSQTSASMTVSGTSSSSKSYTINLVTGELN